MIETTFSQKAKSIYNMLLVPYILLSLPFAFIGAMLALRGFPSWNQLFWILMAMVGARNGGMVLNRLIDKNIDAKNPRTQNRALPKGEVSVFATVFLIIIFLSLFLFSAYKLNNLSFTLAPILMIFLFVYSFLKRYTGLVHFFLGIVQSFAPIGGWIAVQGTFTYITFLLGLGITLWSAGFDVLDKCPDVEFDKSYGLHSIPQIFGIKKALWFSRLFHLLFILIFLSIWYFYQLKIFFLIGVLSSGTILFYGHYLIRHDNLDKVDDVVFYANVFVGLIMLIATVADVLI